MHRIPIIQNLFEATAAARRVGTPGLILTPVFYSIYNNGIVKRNEDIVKSVTGKPKFILCYLNVPHYTYAGNTFYIEEQFCYLDQEGNLLEQIPQNSWSISEIAFYNTDEIRDAHLILHDTQILKYNYADLQFVSRYKLKIQDLWDICGD